MPQGWFHARADILGADVNIWGCFAFLALLIFLFLNSREGRRKGFSTESLFDYGLLVSLSALIGARGLNEWQYHDQYRSEGIAFYSLWDGGLSMFGGVITGIGFTLWFVRRKGFPFWRFVDTITPGTVAAICLVRIGCFFVNDHEGVMTTLPWGIQYPEGVLRHPVGLYLFLNFAVAFGVVWSVRKRYEKEEGKLFLLFGSYYCFSGFLIDFTREESSRGGLIVSQWGELVVFFACLLLLQLRRQGLLHTEERRYEKKSSS